MSDLEKAILVFEAANEGHFPRKESLIRETFDTSAVKYYMKLNRLLATAEAVEANPQLVRRWRERQSGAGRRQRDRLMRPSADA